MSGQQLTIFDAMAEQKKPARLTQEEKIFNYMKEFGSITPVEAFTDLGVMRLGARIYDLEQKGIRINHGTAKARNRFGDKVEYARYSLAE